MPRKMRLQDWGVELAKDRGSVASDATKSGATETSTPQSSSAGRAGHDLEKSPVNEVFKALGTTPKGLSSKEATARLGSDGRNELTA